MDYRTTGKAAEKKVPIGGFYGGQIDPPSPRAMEDTSSFAPFFAEGFEGHGKAMEKDKRLWFALERP